MTSNTNKKEFNEKWMHITAAIIFILGIGAMFLLPWLFSRPGTSIFLDSEKTSRIGSSIGGMTAPAIGLISAGLIYLSFLSQIRMNRKQQKRIDRLEEEKDLELTIRLSKLLVDNLSFVKLQYDNLIETPAMNQIYRENKLTFFDDRNIFDDYIKKRTTFVKSLGAISSILEIDNKCNFRHHELNLLYYQNVDAWNNILEYIDHVINLIKKIDFYKFKNFKLNESELISANILRINLSKYSQFIKKLQ